MGWTPADGIDVPKWSVENHLRRRPCQVITIGLDIAKHVFVHGADERDRAVFSKED
jgi:hypothetical protein